MQYNSAYDIVVSGDEAGIIGVGGYLASSPGSLCAGGGEPGTH